MKLNGVVLHSLQKQITKSRGKIKRSSRHFETKCKRIKKFKRASDSDKWEKKGTNFFIWRLPLGRQKKRKVEKMWLWCSLQTHGWHHTQKHAEHTKRIKLSLIFIREIKLRYMWINNFLKLNRTLITYWTQIAEVK